MCLKVIIQSHYTLGIMIYTSLSYFMFVLLQASVITVCSRNMMHKWCVEQQENGGAPELVLDRSYKFQGGL